jgi:hypothetical protein
MRRRAVIAVVVSIFTVGIVVTAYASQPSGDWKKRFYQANTVYAEGDFDRALELYEELLSDGVESGELYFNIGNCHYRLQDRGRAVLFYERASRLMPLDPDLRANRALMDSDSGIDKSGFGGRQPERILKILFARFTLDGLAIMILLVNVGIFGMLVTGMLVPGVWRPVRAIAILLLVVGLITGAEGVRRVCLYPREAVVLRETQAHFEPQEESTVHFHLVAGEPVRVVKASGDWLKVRRFDGKAGWVDGRICERVSLSLPQSR